MKRFNHNKIVKKCKKTLKNSHIKTYKKYKTDILIKKMTYDDREKRIIVRIRQNNAIK